MKNKITRKDKKKIRAILLCHTGNFTCRKTKVSKENWLSLKNEYSIWLSCFTMSDRKTANSIKK